MDGTRHAALRRLGILEAFAFPLPLLTMWLGVGLLFLALGSVLAPPRPPTEEWRASFDPMDVMANGFVASGHFFPILILELLFVVWTIVGLIQRKAATASTLKWFSGIGAVLTLLAMVLDGGSFWTHPNPRLRGWGVRLVVLPLIWNLFVLWYLRHYPWRWRIRDAERTETSSRA